MNIEASITKNKTNYLEYILYDNRLLNKDNKYLYKTKIDDSLFNKLKLKYNKSKNSNLKFFIKTYRNYIENGVEYTIYDDSEHNIMIYNKQLYDFYDLNDFTTIISSDNTNINDYNSLNLFNTTNVYIANYSKTNLSHSLFNWNNKLNNIINVNRLTFLYKNKIYINFETHNYPNDDKNYYTIYMNFTYNNLQDYTYKYKLLIELSELLK